ncbi:cytochrome c [Pseudorhodobacter sp. W20_MBD10_FR17]|uniref:c-type cytochrome n=1 Tax=Pseudorhodobacter sp. W20_MBD10_FR17 TaxID=3240266 RepID=UPI003F987B05
MKFSVILFPLFLTSAAMAQEQREDWGKHYYTQYCATCHGDEAKGDGDLTELLIVKVPDLTTLSQRNDGKFPLLRVIHIIDGRSGLRAHKEPMPVYGALFREELQPSSGMMGGAEPQIRGRVLTIAEYLQSIQQ